MAAPNRIACSLTVLMIGTIAALPFYDPRLASRLDPAETENEASDAATTSSAATPLQIVTSEPGERDEYVETASQPRASVATGRSTLAANPTVGAPPPIATNFPGVSESVPPVTRESRGAVTPGVAGRDREPVHEDRTTAVNQGTQAREHPIRDGDTLRKLAQRYLGDSGRWREILAANRDILRDPELLPVGKILRIPPSAGGSVVSSRPASAPTDRPLTPLVPIP